MTAGGGPGVAAGDVPEHQVLDADVGEGAAAAVPKWPECESRTPLDLL